MPRLHHITLDLDVHRADAARLMAYHLRLANRYFEAAGEEQGPILAEIARELDADIEVPAARAWIDELNRRYEALDHDERED